jgi:YjbE family integral membrane protein
MIDVAAPLFLLLQIFFVDLLLGADNAVVIALACSRLPPESMRRAAILGAGGAIALRLVMVLFANALLGVPLVKLLGAWMLIVIALNVRANREGDGEAAGEGAAAGAFMSAAAVIMLADAAMSLDNVIALAAIAGGNLWLLAIGVLVSIPILVYGAFILTGIIRHAPQIFPLGAAFLGWIAGGMAATDPLVSGWIEANAPALAMFAPALAALFVLVAGKAAKPALRRIAPASRPRLRVAPAPSLAPALLQEALAVPPGPVRFAAPPRPAAPPPSRPLADAVPPVAPPSIADEATPRFAPEEADAAPSAGWTEERLVVAGFVALAALAGLIIFIASFFDSLT